MREAAPAKINTASVDDVRVDEASDNQCLLPFGDTVVVDGVRAASAGADDWWWQTAWRALKHRAGQPGPFEAYDLAEMGVPEPDHGNRWGALFPRRRNAQDHHPRRCRTVPAAVTRRRSLPNLAGPAMTTHTDSTFDCWTTSDPTSLGAVDHYHSAGMVSEYPRARLGLDDRFCAFVLGPRRGLIRLGWHRTLAEAQAAVVGSSDHAEAAATP